jgi:hypothetical protein
MPRSAFLFRWSAPLLLCVGASAQSPLGELFASDPGAPTVAQTPGTGMTVLPGSELSAGIAPATLKLARGGQVRLCQQSQVVVTSGDQGLMFAMSAGALEVNYHVEAPAADLLVTPDFNIRLAGPGTYHFALGVNGHGDTCFKPLPGNTAGIVFSELLGSEMYGVAADEAAFFAEGKLAGHAALNHSCGCPAPTPPMNTAEQRAVPPRPDDGHAAEHVLASKHEITPSESPDRPGQNPVEVDTPFVFSARATAPPSPVANLEFSALPNVFFAQDEPDPVVLSIKPPVTPAQETKPEPAPPDKKEKKGFGARVKGFFASIFHH